MGRREQLVKKIAKAAKREKTHVIVFPEWASPPGEVFFTWSGRKPTDEEVRAAIEAHEKEQARHSGRKEVAAPEPNPDECERTLEARAVIASNRAKRAPTVWRRCDTCHAPVESTPTLCVNCRPAPTQHTVA